MRTPPWLIPVDDAFPTITRQLLAPLGQDVSERIVSVEYRVKLDGLGVVADSPEFSNYMNSAGA